MFTSNKIKSIVGLTTAGMLSATTLSGCVVSDNPVVNTLATVATVGTIASLFYSTSDGYYYDHAYNRMPRNYQPASNARIQRIDDMDTYRRQHPLDNNRNQQRYENQQMQDQGRGAQNNEQMRERMPQHRMDGNHRPGQMNRGDAQEQQRPDFPFDEDR